MYSWSIDVHDTVEHVLSWINVLLEGVRVTFMSGDPLNRLLRGLSPFFSE